ncbi:hypothetical protein BGZ58_003481, partial [Dissophora ornata]
MKPILREAIASATSTLLNPSLLLHDPCTNKFEECFASYPEGTTMKKALEDWRQVLIPNLSESSMQSLKEAG